jgi:long-subunit acyl-CoA synthetase (AMP-forming)
LKEARPTLFFSVPRVWEKFEEKLREFGASKPRVMQAISNWAKDKALRGNMAKEYGANPNDSPWTYPIAKLFLN